MCFYLHLGNYCNKVWGVIRSDNQSLCPKLVVDPLKSVFLEQIHCNRPAKTMHFLLESRGHNQRTVSFEALQKIFL